MQIVLSTEPHWEKEVQTKIILQGGTTMARKQLCTFLTGLLCLVLCLGVLAGFSDRAEAFCIYNKTDIVVEAKQVGGGKTAKGMSKKISPKDKHCCNWKNKDCNKHA